MGCPLLCLTMLVLLAESYAQPPCTLILPSVLRAGSEETIVLDAQGHNSPFEADIEIRDFPMKKVSLARGKVSVNSANNYLGVVKLLVSSEDLPKDPKRKQFVYVSVKSPSCTLEKPVLLSFQSGLIFIQTNKPIYTRGSIVTYRIFFLNYKLQPSSTPLVIEFLTPDGTIVKRNSILVKDRDIVSQVHELPNHSSLGVWTISAKYENSPTQDYKTNFEVKDYVLPTFKVSLLPRQNAFYADDDTFGVYIKAQFLNGKPVEGTALVLFGVKKDDVKRGIPDTLHRVTIENGEGECSVHRKDLVSFVKPADMSQFTLYVSVTVFTNTGNDLVEAELENIIFMTSPSSPYKILFTETSAYFKPGLPYDFVISVTNPDGSPANRIPVVVEPGQVEGITQEDGTARLTLNTAARTNTLPITVKTSLPGLPLEGQMSASMTAVAYNPLGGIENYLHIGIPGCELKPGEYVTVNLMMRNSDLGTQNQILHVTYLITNKGRIMTVGRQPRQADQSLVTMSLAVTKNHVPSFRIVAYYIVRTSVGLEIVSDCVWVDVKDTCKGTLVLTGDKESDRRVQSPGSPIRLKLRADHKAIVGLVAMDKGVNAMNKNVKTLQSKVLDSLEKQDIGCTAGGGANSAGVFFDAGLAVQTNFNISTAQRSESQCQAPLSRKRRSSVVISEFKTTTSSDYKGQSKEFSQEGIRDSPMDQRRQKRAAEEEEKGQGTSMEDENYLHDEDIFIRTEFQESWLWSVQPMTENPDNKGISTKLLPVFLKDSITTWEVLAVSLSDSNGICVSEPYEIQVTKDFFIDLKLPYSVVRNEQVEIRAVLYNYGRDRIKVQVELTHNPEFCSLSTSKKKFQQIVFVNAHSSFVASFIIVPLSLGDHEIEVKAAVSHSFVSDGVRKKLKIVAEGVHISQIIKSVTLEPKLKGLGGVQTENVSSLDTKNIVPFTEVDTIITIKGSPVSLDLEETVDGNNLNHLITTIPSGNGEQNLMFMTPNVIVTLYLDATNQWEKIGLNRRDQAIQNIRQGYANQLAFRKADNSYGIWIQQSSSTWLTAYVVKVFGLAQTVVDIESHLVCDAIRWLMLERQRPDGSFKEDFPVNQQEIIGGMRGSSEPDIALSAFVLIALLENEKTCTAHANVLKLSIDRTAHFLQSQYPMLSKLHTVAITSYALAKAGFLSETKTLLAASTGNTSWVEPDSAYISLEASSYALLALLEMKQYDMIGPIVSWLTEQKFYGGVSGSTQATIIYFQALVQYHQGFPRDVDLDLHVSLYLPHREQPTVYLITPRNAMLAFTTETLINKDFVVEAKGKGQGTLMVTKVYQAIAIEEERTCNNFDLSVNVTNIDNVLTKRPEGVLSSVALEICFRHRKGDATWSVVEVSMLTGFTPDVEELKKLSLGIDRYISKFEIDKRTTENGLLIINLDKISHTEEDCIKVITHEMFRASVIQPASVTVYEYYNPESRCKRFYHVTEKALLRKVCKGNLCRCAEGENSDDM